MIMVWVLYVMGQGCTICTVLGGTLGLHRGFWAYLGCFTVQKSVHGDSSLYSVNLYICAHKDGCTVCTVCTERIFSTRVRPPMSAHAKKKAVHPP